MDYYGWYCESSLNGKGGADGGDSSAKEGGGEVGEMEQPLNERHDCKKWNAIFLTETQHINRERGEAAYVALRTLGEFHLFQLKSQLKGREQLEARSASDDMDIPVAF